MTDIKKLVGDWLLDMSYKKKHKIENFLKEEVTIHKDMYRCGKNSGIVRIRTAKGQNFNFEFSEGKVI